MIRRLLDATDKSIETIGRGISYLIIFMILIIIYETTMRYLFNAPTSWVHDVSGWLQVVYILIGGSYAFKRGYFVRVDVLYNVFSPRTKLVIDLTVGSILFLAFIYILVVKGAILAYDSVMLNEISSTGQWNGPVWPAKIAIPLGAIFLLFAWFSKTMHDILSKREGNKKS
jgi:TRAP-type mannitol/chloroaromatic compound transport system permease small subunit